MTQPGIVFDGIWKKFQRGEVHDSLRDLIPSLARRLAGNGPRADRLEGKDDFWALEDLSFEVNPGEVLGLIGGNGAGKSTALKIMTSILRPSRGRRIVRGRVGALIEIAAGFHQDLTGRENVFLQGSIMGMPKQLIRQKFDEIVDFSGIGDFIDTPVKRYSSGMNARLGFAIAANLEPEVLIIDEVLAVGDASFQQRAFGRIRDMATSGIPVAIVSHQLDRINSLCTKAIVLQRGRPIMEGAPADCTAFYLGQAIGPSRAQAGTTDGIVHLHTIRVLGDTPVTTGSDVTVEIEGRTRNWFTAGERALQILFRTAHDQTVHFRVSTSVHGIQIEPNSDFKLTVRLQLNVMAHDYTITVESWDDTAHVNHSTSPPAFLRVESAGAYDGFVFLRPRFAIESRPAATDGDREAAHAVAA
ncbi:ABC transporter ATP-binding protein [Gemmatimonadetes bacterium T265]|nr:ABC transporter ATP-binding protein [Gemmatimonadetes bacterium T265]